MNRSIVISAALFLTADVFAIMSLIMPDWIITEVGGETRLGLTSSCFTLYNRPEVCYSPKLHKDWHFTLVSIIVGCFHITIAVICLVASLFYRNMVHGALWIGLTAMVGFSLAAVAFPLGFEMDDIGGQPYQLPNSHQVGKSYILFVLSLWIIVISVLFAGKICLPHF